MAAVSVIIVNYNAGPELAQCVQSVFGSGIDTEIIVVDNGSEDNSIPQLRTRFGEERRLRIIENNDNRGFAVACNQGSRDASGDFLLYLNPDCRVEPDTISILLECLKNYPQAGMAGGLILNHDGTEQRGCRREIPTPWKSLVNTLGLWRLRWLSTKLFSDFRLDRRPLPDRPEDVEAISGAGMLVSRAALADVGPLDEDYFLHCEDLDWCKRFSLRGWKIVFVPQARLVHSKGSCSASCPEFVERHKHRGMVLFYRKFFAGADSLPKRCVVLSGIWLRYVLARARIFLRKLLGPGHHGN